VTLVETAGIASKNGDGHLMQFSVAILLVLHSIASANGEEGAPLLGLRDGELFGRLLYLHADLAGNEDRGKTEAPASIDIGPRDHQRDEDGAYGEPAAKA